MKQKLSKLEAIRGAAAFYVILHHIHHHSSLFHKIPGAFYFFEFGQEAVILFFIMSGFVIEYSFSRSKDKSFKTYFFKRFNRIYIPLIIVFLTNIGIQFLEAKTMNFDTKNLICNILMLQDLPHKPNVLVTPFLGNTPLWSLSYEWWFYMIFFLLQFLFKEKVSNAIYTLCIISTLSYIVYPFMANRIVMYLMVWNLGREFAKLYLNQSVIGFRNLRIPIFMMSICVILLGLNFYFNKESVHRMINFNGNFGIGISPFLELRHFSFALFAMLAGIIWLKLKWWGFKFTIGIFEPLAKVSYCLYISHWFLMIDATYLSFVEFPFIRYLLYFIVCVLFSYMVEIKIYPWVNRKMLKMVNNK